MAKYKDLVGTGVVNFAGDNPAAVKGQLWYDSTNKDFKYLFPNVTSAGSWRTGPSINTARYYGAGAGASRDASLIFGGEDGSSNVAITESFDGSSWTEVNDLNQHKYTSGGAGTSTAGLIFGGGTTPPYGVLDETETWNGTNWTEVNDLNNAKKLFGANGTTTSGLIYGGEPSSGTLDQTESWNGTNWTEVNDLNTARRWYSWNWYTILLL